MYEQNYNKACVKRIPTMRIIKLIRQFMDGWLCSYLADVEHKYNKSKRTRMGRNVYNQNDTCDSIF